MPRTRAPSVDAAPFKSGELITTFATVAATFATQACTLDGEEIDTRR